MLQNIALKTNFTSCMELGHDFYNKIFQLT